MCKRPITLGVMQRVEDLARRDVRALRGEDGLIRSPDGRPPYRSLVSLQQILSEAIGVGVNAKRVQNAYLSLVNNFGGELATLLDVPPKEVAAAAPPQYSQRISEGLEKVRAGNIHIVPGFDGQYGSVKVWPDESAPNAPIESPSSLRLL